MRLSCPDLTRSGQLTAIAAQHAHRQGKALPCNVAAILGHGSRKLYKHRDLGFVVGLRGYARSANRLRVATGWVNDLIEHRQLVQLDLIPREYSGLTAAGHAAPTTRQTDTPRSAGERPLPVTSSVS